MNSLIWAQSPAINVGTQQGLTGLQRPSGEGAAPPPPITPTGRGGGSAAVFACLLLHRG